MPRFSKRSLANLENVHPSLQKLMHEAIKHIDFTVTDGYRSVERQKELYAQGRTKPGKIVTNIDGVRKKSMHNHFPALAVDIAPYPINYYDSKRFIFFAGILIGISKMMKIPIRWGGDWNKNYELSDEGFIDLPHFELVDVR